MPPATVDRAIKQLSRQLTDRERSWVKMGTLIALSGRKRASPALTTELKGAIAAANIFHLPADLENCRPDDTVLISTTPFRDPGLRFQDESELAEFVVRHFRRLAPFARCTRVVREELWGDVKVDLCFRERKGVVVCELEHSTGRYETASQIRRYVEAVQAKVDGTGKAVRGVVVTGAPNPAEEAEVAQWSKESGCRVEWYYYRLALDLEAAPL
jgi:hypothetical protein